MKKLLLSISAIYILSSAQGQFVTDYLKAANTYYQKGDLFSAAQYYEKYIDTANAKINRNTGYNPYAMQAGAKVKKAEMLNKQQAIYRLAEIYTQLKYPAKALPFYELSTGFSAEQYPNAWLQYAKTNRALGKYDVAASALDKYLAIHTAKDAPYEEAVREKANVAFIQQQLKRKDTALYTVKPAAFNAAGATYAPLVHNGQMYFTSTRLDSAAQEKQYLNRLYKVDVTTGAPQRFFTDQNADTHHGVAALTPDGKTMYFTRWSKDHAAKNAQIFQSNFENGKWQPAFALDSTINRKGYSSEQPHVSADGKYLFFSSNMPGGVGGFDIYAAKISGTTPGTPVNLGANINTNFDEQAPFYHAGKQKLVYSSNGRVGMGGFDFYEASGQAEAFGKSTNLGYPINTQKDDIYFFAKATNPSNWLDDVYVSSDRSSACCLEMFQVHKDNPLKQITGTVISCEDASPVKGATVTIVNASNQQVIGQATTNEAGHYTLSFAEFTPVNAMAIADGYLSNQLTVQMPEDVEQALVVNNPQICLSKPKDPAQVPPIIIPDALFEFNSAALTEGSQGILDDVVTKLKADSTLVLLIDAYTDSKGADEYNRKLSEKRAGSVQGYLTKKGISDRRLYTKAHGEENPVAPNENADGTDNAEGRAKNRRTEIRVIKK
ncbi:MAG: flagellar motor protein MotB [Bacteroidetes bacterium]|nr:MAG: flagellar motor protein MotB [Bacteroidota bacterium]